MQVAETAEMEAEKDASEEEAAQLCLAPRQKKLTAYGGEQLAPSVALQEQSCASGALGQVRELVQQVGVATTAAGACNSDIGTDVTDLSSLLTLSSCVQPTLETDFRLENGRLLPPACAVSCSPTSGDSVCAKTCLTWNVLLGNSPESGVLPSLAVCAPSVRGEPLSSSVVMMQLSRNS